MEIFRIKIERWWWWSALMVLLFAGRMIPSCESYMTLRMGVLRVGVPQKWSKSKNNLSYVRKAGVRQFISTYNRVKDLKGDELLWGEEVEYGIFHISPESKTVRLCLRAKEIMDQLNEQESMHEHLVEGCHWVPEYGAWMIEATPRGPYTGYTGDLIRVERNMRLRRKRLLHFLKEGEEIAPTVSTFPLLGALGNDGSVPPTEIGGDATQSEYIGDGIINPHPRFGTLSANIRQRRGGKVNIRIPLYRDTDTPEYQGFPPTLNVCGGDNNNNSDGGTQVWRYGKNDYSVPEKYGNHFVSVGCSKSDPMDDSDHHDGVTDVSTIMQKWRVDVQCEGCLGLFYRSAPGVIVADADWPRNGDIVYGYEIPEIPGWIRLQNGYYLPMASDDDKVRFLYKLSTSKPNKSTNGVDANNDGNGTNQIADEGLEDEFEVDETKEKMPNNIRPAIHMDAMAFGMGCCCLQITFQAKDVDESRYMYDQLAVMAPIMMALTASTPVMKGRLADVDCRWGVISESVDCRTPAERGSGSSSSTSSNSVQPELVGNGQRRIQKSRYDSISTYIFQENGQNHALPGMGNRVLNMYNDIPVPIDEESYQLIRDAGVDPALSQHIAHLFIRDPLVIFEGAVEEVDDETQTEHFESIQSTNWQTVRWKPPPPRNNPNDPHIGWRTEFRSMEIQLTDYENAAFTVFTVLLTRVILSFDLNLYIPLSHVDANMQRAHSRDAARKGKFFFRRHMAPLEEGDDGYGVKYSSIFKRVGNSNNSQDDDDVTTNNSNTSNDDNNTTNDQSKAEDNNFSEPRRNVGSDEENSYEEMTIDEIMNGKGDYFPGLIPLVLAYLDFINCDDLTLVKLKSYMDFISKRASGELLTPATWMRNFIKSHPAYKNDSVVSSEIAYDLMIACTEIGEGKRHEPTLLGDDVLVKPISKDGAYDVKLDSTKVNNENLLDLLRRYSNRKSFSG